MLEIFTMIFLHKGKYEEEKGALNKKDTREFDYKKSRLTDYLYESKEEEEEKQTDKNPEKKNHLKSQQKVI